MDMSFLLVGLICLVVVAFLGILLRSFLKYITPSQVLLFGIELTLAGGIFIIGLTDILQGSEIVGMFLVLIGLLFSVIGFFSQSNKE
jgi:hypothetical protein